MVVLTTSIIIPLVVAAGFDLIWFGIYIVLVVEMAQITPPVGFNLYVLQGMTGRNIFTIGAYALPLFFLICVAVARPVPPPWPRPPPPPKPGSPRGIRMPGCSREFSSFGSVLRLTHMSPFQ